MAREKKLKAGLDRYKGVDYKLERQKKLQKEAEKKRKRSRSSKISELREEEYVMSGALTPLKEKKDLFSKAERMVRNRNKTKL